jgi:hypothetical protein
MATAPAPPQVGVPVTRDSLNAQLGAASQSLRKSTVSLQSLNEWGAAYNAQQLSDLYGYTLEEAALLKSALGEVPALVALVEGFQFLDKTWGS